MKKKLIITIILIMIIGAVYFITKKETLAPTKTEIEAKPIELCFAKFGEPNESGFYDKYTLRLVLSGEGGRDATGELKLLPAEKDSKTGTFKGTVGPVDKMMMARTAELWWDTFAEGMHAKEQLRIIFGEGTANIGFAEMIDKGNGSYVYKDPANINYSLSLTDVACSDLTERENVENYLRSNIATLSPVKAVLGGTWYVVSSTIDLKKKTGTVTYEDGHIQEKKNFSYTVDQEGNILSLTIE